MGILTVRLSEEEERLLERRSRSAGMKKASFVRRLIREQPLETAGNVLADALGRMGDARLRVIRRGVRQTRQPVGSRPRLSSLDPASNSGR